MVSDDPLRTLLDRLGGGDAAAAEQVFREYEPYLRKVVRRQLPLRFRRKFDSVDVVQSVWADLVRVWGGAGCRFTTAGHLRAFLVKATRNRFIDRVRQNRAALAHEVPAVPGGVYELASAKAPQPSEVAQAGELWDQMLALCPPEHRPLLQLRRQGFSLEEVAARTGLHEGSVRRVLRGLARRLAFHPPGGADPPGPNHGV